VLFSQKYNRNTPKTYDCRKIFTEKNIYTSQKQKIQKKTKNVTAIMPHPNGQANNKPESNACSHNKPKENTQSNGNNIFIFKKGNITCGIDENNRNTAHTTSIKHIRKRDFYQKRLVYKKI
jgi:hypothetical protein